MRSHIRIPVTWALLSTKYENTFSKYLPNSSYLIPGLSRPWMQKGKRTESLLKGSIYSNGRNMFQRSTYINKIISDANKCYQESRFR